MDKIIIYQVFTRLFGNKNKPFELNGAKEINGVGKLNDITKKGLEEIKKLGISHIWYTGIIEHAIVEGYPEFNIKGHNPLVVKGLAGSPYAICDYYDVNPDLAVDVKNRMKEFEDLVERTHQQNMGVIIDFVPNHLARRYQSDNKPDHIKDFGDCDDESKAFDLQNNFYYLPEKALKLPHELYEKTANFTDVLDYSEFPAKATGNDKFYHELDSNDWYETVKLNYGRDYINNQSHYDPIPDTWKKMLDILLYWASKKIDGFRCDMAEMVPVEFWNWVIPKVKSNYPDILFIAEIYNPQQYSNYLNFGYFDYLYDKVGLYDAVRSIITSDAKTELITQCWQKLNGNDSKMLRFLENHDEQRIASKFFANNSENGIPGVVVSLMMNIGPFMIYFGQEVGEPAMGESGFSGDDGRTTIFDYWNVPEHQKWMNEGKFDGGGLSAEQKRLKNTYQFLLNYALDNEAISSGKFYDLLWSNKENSGFESGKIYAFLRYTEKQKLLFIVSFNHTSSNLTISIPDHALIEMKLVDQEEFNFTSRINDSYFDISKNDLIEKGINLNLEAMGFDIIELK